MSRRPLSLSHPIGNMTHLGVPVTLSREERAERIAAMRAQMGDELVSHAYDPAPLAIGAVVSQRVDGEAAHRPVTGRVVERWVDPETGEGGVVLVEFWRKTVLTHRLRMADCVTDPALVRPPSASSCAQAARAIFAAVGAGTGEITEAEDRQLHWCEALLRAGHGPADYRTTPTQGETP